MGLIDSKKAIKALTHWETEATDEEIIYTINNLPTVEAIPKDRYEARLKADMVAMLEVIKLRIDNLPEPLNRDRVNYCVQQKINELKGNEDQCFERNNINEEK